MQGVLDKKSYRADAVVSGEFHHELKEYAMSLGAELYGVTSAEYYGKEFPGKLQPGRFVEGASSVIVIGIPFEPGTCPLRVKAADQAAS
ncbi:MAG: hypothetical protein QGG73_06000 [Candidatus Hydrogenedentes bacterium]|jgi:hypothetical protein|nr:hypothetical protein [Candidatus Hydrogenedentota bacterium]